MENFFVYILQCSDRSYYVGHTDDIEKRISEHRLKTHNCYTSTRLPVELVFCQQFFSRAEALEAERKIKEILLIAPLDTTPRTVPLGANGGRRQFLKYVLQIKPQ
jgi:putative endonuclease